MVKVRALVLFGVVVVAGVFAEVSCGADFVPRGVKGNLVPFASDFADPAVVAVACAVAASSAVVVSEMVSRNGEREFVIVAGATMVIERVTGVGDAVVLLGAVVVAGVEGVAVPLPLPFPEGVPASSLCCCMTSEKLCD